MWTLASELTAVTGTADIARALKSAGICRPDCGKCQPGGSELCWRPADDAYIAEFTVLHTGQPPQAVIIKACTGLSGLSGAGHIADQWAQRYALLRHMGLEVPQTYWTYRGCIAQEHIPLDFAEAWLASQETRPLLAWHLGKLCGVLDGCRFSPIRLGGLRSHGSDLVIVNVGNDLGPPWNAPPGSKRPRELGSALVCELANGITMPGTHEAFTTGYARGRADAVRRIPPACLVPGEEKLDHVGGLPQVSGLICGSQTRTPDPGEHAQVDNSKKRRTAGLVFWGST